MSQVEDWYCHGGWTALTRQRHSGNRWTNTERQTGWYRPHACVQSIAFFTDWLALALYFSLPPLYTDKVPVSLPSLQCANQSKLTNTVLHHFKVLQIGADNLPKPLFSWTLMCVRMCVYMWLGWLSDVFCLCYSSTVWKSEWAGAEKWNVMKDWSGVAMWLSKHLLSFLILNPSIKD